jgi:DNA-directed RNA polymerase sigma subunit (sigma70/sigma32)
MSAEVVENEQDTALWLKAKSDAKNAGHEGDWAFVINMYKEASGIDKNAAPNIDSDEELIVKWKTGNDYTAYRKLKEKNRGMVMQAVNTYRAANVPSSSLEAEAWTLFDDAVNNFKTTEGAKFSTYLSYQLRKLDRHTKKYQNIARIPEALAGKIGDYDRVSTALAQKNGKQPTNQEMAKAMGMSVKHVKQLNTSRRGDIYESWNPEDGGINQDERTNWMLIELRDELNDQERKVYDHLIGYQTKMITNKRQLAEKLGMSAGRISQITGDISRKISPHLKKKP